MACSSSSSQPIPTQLFLNPYNNPTSAPPPTPSTQPTTTTSTTAEADTLTRLLHRLPPTLSFPTRFSPRSTTPTTTKTQLLPTISLSTPSTLTSSSFELGYFQLSPLDHLISSQLAKSAEFEALSLLDLPNEQRHSFFPKDWPLGYDDGDDDGDHTASFCLDSHLCTATESSVKLTSLGELTSELEKVGLHVVEKLACFMGFENPFRENGLVRSSSLMWVSLSEAEKTSKLYPFVVGLQYQIRAQKWSLGLDSGSINVEPEVGSLLVTFGDIAQVWSNGRLKKVRGRPTAVPEEGAKSGSRVISMTMLLTLPLESTVSPLLVSPTNITEMENVKPHKECNNEGVHNDRQNVKAASNNENNDQDDNEDLRVFNSFSFEDYAWRVYNERCKHKFCLICK